MNETLSSVRNQYLSVTWISEISHVYEPDIFVDEQRFGPCLPAEEIACAVKKVNAKALAISIGHAINDLRMYVELKKIRRYLGWEIPIFVWSGGADTAAATLGDINAIQADDLRQFRLRIEALCRNGHGETLEEGFPIDGDPGQITEQ